MPQRYYSSTAGAMTLAADVGAGDTTLQVSSVVGLPASYPFTLILDPGGSEEIVTVTAGSGTSLTVTRASDGTSAQSHSLGDPVRHGISARDLREPQEHIAATADVHGVVGNLVGADQTQDLTNKTLKAASASTKAAVVKAVAGQTATILDVQDSTGASVVSVQPSEGTLSVGTTEKTNSSGPAGLFKYIKRIIVSAADVVGLQVRAAAGQTADLQQWQDSAGATLAKVDKDGKVTAPGVTSTGPVSGTTGSFSGALNASGGATLSGGTTISGSVTQPSGGTVYGDFAATGQYGINMRRKATTGANQYEGAIYLSDGGTVSHAAIVLRENGTEANRLELLSSGGALLGPVGARSNVGVVSTAKSGKRIHWDVATVSTDSSGYATVTHGAGFTPTAVVITPSTITWRVTADNFTSTTFRVRTFNSTGAGVPLVGVTLSYLCGE